MFKAIVNHFKRNQHLYFWPIIGAGALLFSFDVTYWFNHGRPILDDVNALAGYGIEAWPVLLALIFTAIYSQVLNNSLTREEYAKASSFSQFVENLPELVIFLAILAHFHFHS